MKTYIGVYGYELLTRTDRKKNGIPFHVLIAERALGKPLPMGAEVHHANGIKADNRPSNLVICPDRAYHKLLHQRMRAKKACGNANWRICTFCQRYDAPENIFVPKGKHKAAFHRRCRARYESLRMAKKTGGRSKYSDE